ncbi:hypothetical protein N9W79_02300 [bacterium]|nr:hypothetical protein [bacterium]
MSLQTTELLEKAWEARMVRNIDACRALLSRVKIDLNLELGQINPETIFDLTDLCQLKVDALALIASVARAEDQFDYSLALLKALSKTVTLKALPQSFRLNQELAHSYFTKDDLPNAVEYYYSSKAIAKTPMENYIASINVLICLEDLDLDSEESHNTALKDLENLESSLGKENSAIGAALAGYGSRKDFFNGKIRKSLESYDNIDSALAEFSKAYYESFPYHSSYQNSKHQYVDLIPKANRLYLSSYRLRTIAELSNPGDVANTGKIREASSRLYLWLWKWMIEPERLPFQKVVSLLTKEIRLGSSKSCKRILAHYRIVFTWMQLFSPGPDSWVKSLISSFALPIPTSKLLELEYLTASYFILLRDGKSNEAEDLLFQLKSHPLWDSGEVHFPRLIEAVRKCDTTNLPAQLKTLASEIIVLTKKMKSSSSALHVDTTTFEVNSKNLKTPLVSQPLTLALKLLTDRKKVKKDDFLFEVFQLANYNPSMHDAKIFNLTARIKKLLPTGASVKSKEGLVFAVGDWSDVNIVELCLHSELLSHNAEWNSITSSSVFPKRTFHRPIQETLAFSKSHTSNNSLRNWSTTSTNNSSSLKTASSDERLTMFNVGDNFNREVIQDKLKVPRSTANRLIAKWVKDGALLKEGSGRSTRYIVKDRN